MSHSYKDLLVWQKAMRVAELVYVVTRSFPREETYDLAAQLRRAAVSVVSNIAEGQGRSSIGEFRHFVGIARGSALEVETQILLSMRFGYMPQDEGDTILALTDEIKRMLHGLSGALGRPAEEFAVSH